MFKKRLVLKAAEGLYKSIALELPGEDFLQMHQIMSGKDQNKFDRWIFSPLFNFEEQGEKTSWKNSG
jgi:hypothetical protein